MSRIEIYFLMDKRGVPRYIGRAQDAKARLGQHWKNCDLTGQWWNPKNLWLRSLRACPEMMVFAVVEEESNQKEDWPFIEDARNVWPGMLTNREPIPIPEPEMELFDRLAKADDPKFNIAAFHEEKKNNQRKAVSAPARARMLRLSADPEYRAKVEAAASAAIKRLAATDPEYRAKLQELGSATMRKLWANPEFAAKVNAALSAARNANWSDPEYQAKMSANTKKQWEDADYHARMSGIARETRLRNWSDPEFRAKMLKAFEKRGDIQREQKENGAVTVPSIWDMDGDTRHRHYELRHPGTTTKDGHTAGHREKAQDHIHGRRKGQR
jgi:hypothetical protein